VRSNPNHGWARQGLDEGSARALEEAQKLRDLGLAQLMKGGETYGDAYKSFGSAIEMIGTRPLNSQPSTLDP